MSAIRGRVSHPASSAVVSSSTRGSSSSLAVRRYSNGTRERSRLHCAKRPRASDENRYTGRVRNGKLRRRTTGRDKRKQKEKRIRNTKRGGSLFGACGVPCITKRGILYTCARDYRGCFFTTEPLSRRPEPCRTVGGWRADRAVLRFRRRRRLLRRTGRCRRRRRRRRPTVADRDRTAVRCHAFTTRQLARWSLPVDAHSTLATRHTAHGRRSPRGQKTVFLPSPSTPRPRSRGSR